MYQHVYSLTIDHGVCRINIEVENSKHKFNKRKIVKCERLKLNNSDIEQNFVKYSKKLHIIRTFIY